MLDYLTFFEDYGIDYATEGPNVGNNYIGVMCPWCGDTSYHGGVPKNGQHKFTCWRCGGHSLEATLSRMTGLKDIQSILSKYDDGASTFNTEQRVLVHPERKVVVPGGDLEWYHRKYLEKRRYDPDYLIREYKVKGTTPTSEQGTRVYFPIYYGGEVVSYQGRSIRDDAYLRYLTASPDEEKVFHKSILFNLDNCKSETIVMVEGVFDALRLGKYDVCATFGTGFMPEQLLLLKPYKRIFMLYDSEIPAQEKAKKAANMIANISGGEVYTVNLGEGDPDELSDDDAKKLMNDLRRKVY
jgi:hypothetical protein